MVLVISNYAEITKSNLLTLCVSVAHHRPVYTVKKDTLLWFANLLWFSEVSGCQCSSLGMFVGTLPSFVRGYRPEGCTDCLQINFYWLLQTGHVASCKCQPHCVLMSLSAKQWKRTGTIPWPTRSAFTGQLSRHYRQGKGACAVAPMRKADWLIWRPCWVEFQFLCRAFFCSLTIIFRICRAFFTMRSDSSASRT